MTAFDKAWGVVKVDDSIRDWISLLRLPKNRINWGVHDSQETHDRYGEEYLVPPRKAGTLSQIEAPEHPDGLVIPCTFCDEMSGEPEYCEGVKWQVDEGLEGFYTSCDRQLQTEIDDRANDLHDMDAIEWIQRIEPAATNWPMVERHHNVTRTASDD